MFRYGIALLVAATTLSHAPGPAAARTAFDGRWSVMIQTESGECDRAYRYGVDIVNGTVSYAGDSSFVINGRVTPNGKLRVRLSRGQQRAEGTGHLSQTDGTGVWRGVSGSGVCTGRWFAERRN
jgi:hypothetical protein